ncbi:NUDIX domain-containing protein [Microbulbifer sp. SSSA005]|uniref:NUDIX domain-containing protein n=1 Tax=unclassified Microbulbifer TaxID=2619833 RepID=UPI0040396818
MFHHTVDSFNCVTLDLENFSGTENQFLVELVAIIEVSRVNSRKLIWIDLRDALTRFIPICLKHGFTFHSCRDSATRLVLKLQEDAYVPFYPTHTVGVGGFVLLDGQLLCVQGHSAASSPKLPGGTVDLGEKIADAVIREVYEETGVSCEFSSVLGFATRFPTNLGYTDIYFVCELSALNRDISITDTEEIKHASWVDIDHYLNGGHISAFNRHVAEMSMQRLGLTQVSQDSYKDPFAKQEIFWTNA